MPYINKPKRNPSQRNENTASRELRRKAYSNTAWRKLRDLFLRQHPLCERCMANGRTVPAEDIHHKKSPFRNGEIDYSLLLDEKNLEALCKKCHGEEHGGVESPDTIIDRLDALLNGN